jgi:hypothetical protein
MARVAAALVVEPVSRSAGKQRPDLQELAPDEARGPPLQGAWQSRYSAPIRIRVIFEHGGLMS